MLEAGDMKTLAASGEKGMVEESPVVIKCRNALGYRDKFHPTLLRHAIHKIDDGGLSRAVFPGWQRVSLSSLGGNARGANQQQRQHQSFRRQDPNLLNWFATLHFGIGERFSDHLNPTLNFFKLATRVETRNPTLTSLSGDKPPSPTWRLLSLSDSPAA